MSFHFISALDLNPECIAVPVLVPLRQKVSVPSGTGSGSTTLGEFFLKVVNAMFEHLVRGLRVGLFDPCMAKRCLFPGQTIKVTC